MKFYPRSLVVLFLTFSTFLYGQGKMDPPTEETEVDSITKQALQNYTEADFIKMQEHYKKDTEVIEMMKLKSMAGNANADIFLEFLNLPYDQAKLKHGTEVVASVIYTYYESVSLLSRFDELNNELDTANAAYNKNSLLKKLPSEVYVENAKFIWDELVPESGQANMVAGELLRAVEKLRDEAQRNANVNFSELCHNLLIDYLRTHLNNTELFDIKTIKTINLDLDRLELQEQPYTGDVIYNRLSRRVVDWFLLYGGTKVNKNDPNLQC